jgi:hypothetical protein
MSKEIAWDEGLPSLGPVDPHARDLGPVSECLVIILLSSSSSFVVVHCPHDSSNAALVYPADVLAPSQT